MNNHILLSCFLILAIIIICFAFSKTTTSTNSTTTTAAPIIPPTNNNNTPPVVIPSTNNNTSSSPSLPVSVPPPVLSAVTVEAYTDSEIDQKLLNITNTCSSQATSIKSLNDEANAMTQLIIKNQTLLNTLANIPRVTNFGAALGSVVISDSTTISNQSAGAVLIGSNAGNSNQGNQSIAVGSSAGSVSQGDGAIAVGNKSGNTSQGENSIAIGNQAGQTMQGKSAIAIGYNAANSGQADNSICLDASGDTQISPLIPATTGLFIKPIRTAISDTTTNQNTLQYDSATCEVYYKPVSVHPVIATLWLASSSAAVAANYIGNTWSPPASFWTIQIAPYTNNTSNFAMNNGSVTQIVFSTSGFYTLSYGLSCSVSFSSWWISTLSGSAYTGDQTHLGMINTNSTSTTNTGDIIYPGSATYHGYISAGETLYLQITSGSGYSPQLTHGSAYNYISISS